MSIWNTFFKIADDASREIPVISNIPNSSIKCDLTVTNTWYIFTLKLWFWVTVERRKFPSLPFSIFLFYNCPRYRYNSDTANEWLFILRAWKIWRKLPIDLENRGRKRSLDKLADVLNCNVSNSRIFCTTRAFSLSYTRIRTF